MKEKRRDVGREKRNELGRKGALKLMGMLKKQRIKASRH